MENKTLVDKTEKVLTFLKEFDITLQDYSSQELLNLSKLLENRNGDDELPYLEEVAVKKMKEAIEFEAKLRASLKYNY